MSELPHLVCIFWGSLWPPLAPVPAVCSVPLVVLPLLCGASSPGTTYPSLSDSSQSPRHNHDAEEINKTLHLNMWNVIRLTEFSNQWISMITKNKQNITKITTVIIENNFQHFYLISLIFWRTSTGSNPKFSSMNI